MDSAISNVKQTLQSLKQRYRFVELRSRFISEPSEKVFHEIGLLKAEKELLMLVRSNLAAVITSPDPEIRNMINDLKKGAVTGLLLSKELSWDELSDYTNLQIQRLEKKLASVEAKERELAELMQD